MKILQHGPSGVAEHYWPDAEIDAVAEEGVRYDIVLSAHRLQTLRREDALPTLKYYFDVLRVGGELILMVPDIVASARQIAFTEDVDTFALHTLYGTAERPHQSGYTLPLLRSLLNVVGFFLDEARVGPYTITINGEMKEAKQLYIRGTKPEQPLIAGGGDETE